MEKAKSTMTQDELLSRIAEKTGLSKGYAKTALKALGEVVEESLTSGRSVNLPGIGRVYRAERKARTCKIPHTEKVVEIPATFVPKINFFKQAKEAAARGK